MERILQYVWKHKLYPEDGMATVEGEPVFIIDTGVANSDAGPDFFNAKVRIGHTVWVGNVEIHARASDWYAHGHHRDKAYDSVVLHVVGFHDRTVYRTNGEPILQMTLQIPEKIKNNIDWLLTRDTPVFCSERIGKIPPIYLSDWKAALLSERLERKASDIRNLLEQYGKDWNEIFYITLMRNFGFGANSDAFEWLAKSLPWKYILKHRNRPLQVEALLFGQAGLLEADNIPNEDAYFETLCREYAFLRQKYGLQPVEGYLFRKLRTRPVNFPHVRIAQIAALWMGQDVLFSKIIDTEDLREMLSFFEATPTDYWTTHYHFGEPSVAKKKALGKNALQTILINTVIPILFAYGKQKSRPVYCDRALSFLEKLPPERNHIVTFFEQAGISARDAGDTQALIQLRRAYCEKKKCLYCRIGFRIIDN